MCLPGPLPPKWKTRPLSHDFPVDSTTWAFLERIDEDLAAHPCPHCGGRLRPRKPRGVERPLVAGARRLSFCCARCRRRVTPPSVRYAAGVRGLRLRVSDSHVAGEAKSRVPVGPSGRWQTYASAVAAVVARDLRRDLPVAQAAHPFLKTADDAAAGRDVLRPGGSSATAIAVDEQVRRRGTRRTCRLFQEGGLGSAPKREAGSKTQIGGCDCASPSSAPCWRRRRRTANYAPRPWRNRSGGVTDAPARFSFVTTLVLSGTASRTGSGRRPPPPGTVGRSTHAVRAAGRCNCNTGKIPTGRRNCTTTTSRHWPTVARSAALLCHCGPLHANAAAQAAAEEGGGSSGGGTARTTRDTQLRAYPRPVACGLPSRLAPRA